MKTNLEIEYKTLLNKQEYHQILTFFKPIHVVHQTNFYYQSSTILNKKVAARIRQIDQNFELTFKIKQAKGKLEVNFDVPSNSAEHFNRADVQQFLREHNFLSKWKYVGELHTTRYSIHEEYGELCIDHNQYLGIEDYELEYEVKNDFEIQAYTRFLAILNQFSLNNIKAKAKFHRFILTKLHQD